MIFQCQGVSKFFDWNEPGVLQEIVYMIIVGLIFFTVLLLNSYGVIRKISNYLVK